MIGSRFSMPPGWWKRGMDAVPPEAACRLQRRQSVSFLWYFPSLPALLCCGVASRAGAGERERVTEGRMDGWTYRRSILYVWIVARRTQWWRCRCLPSLCCVVVMVVSWVVRERRWWLFVVGVGVAWRGERREEGLVVGTVQHGGVVSK